MFRRVLDSAMRTDRARQTAHRRAVFALEGLESRRVLSTFTWTGNAGTAWSTSGNWLKEGQATSSLPGSGTTSSSTGPPM